MPPAATPGFVNADVHDAVTLHPPCQALAAKRIVLQAFGAFNAGRGPEFAAVFAPGRRFSPSGYRHGIGREAAIRFVKRRHRLGDEWTALVLRPPLGNDTPKLPDGTVRSAVYQLDVRVTQAGRVVHPVTGVKVVISCTNGLVTGWVGP